MERLSTTISFFYDLLDKNNKTKQRGWVRNILRIPTTEKIYFLFIKNDTVVKD
jgi:hypothetical protein